MEVRKLTEDEVEFTLTLEEEDVKVDDSFEDQEIAKEIKERLYGGDEWAWCYVKIEAHWHGFKGVCGVGCCSYENEEAFKDDFETYNSMKEDALEDLNTGVQTVANAIEELVVKSSI